MLSKNYCEIASHLELAIDTLQSHGIRIPNSGRFNDYLSILNQACRAQLAGKNNKDIAIPPSLFNFFVALCEANDLTLISQLPSKEIINNKAFVQRLMAGQYSYTETKQSHQSRDCQFQLVTASFFQRANAQVWLESPTDVMAHVGIWPVAIECKRPTTIPALRRRIEEGINQLRRHDQQGLNAIRMIAIDLTFLINNQFKVLLADSDSHAADLIDQHIRQFFLEAKDDLQRAYRNSKEKVRLDCFLYRVQCMVANPNDGNERIGDFWRIQDLTKESSQVKQALSEVVKSMPGFLDK